MGSKAQIQGDAGGRLYRSANEFDYELDTLTSLPAGLVVGGIFQGALQISTDADFEIMRRSYFADIAAAAQTDSTRVIPLVTVLEQPAGSVVFMNAPVPLPSRYGTGELPFILPETIIISAGSSLLVTLSNFSAASIYNIRLTFHGRKLFN